ncbi:MAG TPA: hypothetical protein VI137_04350 [Pseudolabrys sp.]|jgi:hypothetical protein
MTYHEKRSASLSMRFKKTKGNPNEIVDHIYAAGSRRRDPDCCDNSTGIGAKSVGDPKMR